MKYNLSESNFNKSILISGARDECLKPSQVFLEDTDVLENTEGKSDDCGKFIASTYLVIQIQIQIVHVFVIVL